MAAARLEARRAVRVACRSGITRLRLFALPWFSEVCCERTRRTTNKRRSWTQRLGAFAIPSAAFDVTDAMKLLGSLFDPWHNSLRVGCLEPNDQRRLLCRCTCFFVI